MSDSGWIAIDRGILDHPLFERRKQPFSELEAWIWLLLKAAWRDRRQWAIGRMFSLRRGQLLASPRFLAGHWRWSEGSARRFVARLAAENMVRAETDSKVTILTICNYDKYQLERLTNEARPAHDRRKEEQGNNTGDDGGEARRGKSLICEEAFSIATEIIAAMGLHPHDPLSVGAPMAVQSWLNSGFHRDHIIFGVRRTMAKRQNNPPSSLRYFDKAIARAMADLTAPPVTGTSDAQSSPQPSFRLHSNVAGNAPGGGLANLQASLQRAARSR